MIAIGNNNIKDIQKGSTPIERVMKGNQLIWERRGVRYIRDSANGSNANLHSHWIEIAALKDGVDVARGKVPTLIRGRHQTNWALSNVTDGRDATYGATEREGTLQVDLGRVIDIDAIRIKHYFIGNRRYNNTKLEVSKDGRNWRTIFDSAVSGTYLETQQGKTYIL